MMPNDNQMIAGWDANAGRWPANVILDDAAAELVDEQSGERPAGRGGRCLAGFQDSYVGGSAHKEIECVGYNDVGFASRFYQRCNWGEEDVRFAYVPKASRAERDAGLEGLEERRVNKMGSFGNQEDYDCPDGAHRKGDKGSARMRNHHATVKPIALMRYLCRLTKTPTGGVVLDPFMGSGSTGCAAVMEGRAFIGIELDPEYCEIARRRIEHWQMQPRLGGLDA